MTRVAYIHGPEVAQRADNVKRRTPALPYQALTEGESLLWIAYKRLALLGDYYPEARQSYNKVMSLIQDVLKNGLHVFGPHLLSRLNADSDIDTWAYNLISSAQERAEPSYKTIIGRKTPASIANIPIPDCSQFVTETDLGQGNFEYNYLPGFEDCQQETAWIYALNEQLKKTSHHFLYEWQTEAHVLHLTASSAGTIAAKKTLHKNGVSAVANVADMKRSVMAAYMETAIMERNIEKKMAPMNGSQTIFQLREGAGIPLSKAGTINGLSFAAWIIPLLKVLVEAAVAIATLVATIKALKKRDIKTGQLASIGSEDFSADGTDFQKSSKTSILDNNNLLLLAAGGLLFMSEK